MNKTFKDVNGDDFSVDFTEHDISKYDVLFHVTLKTNRKSVEEKGLVRNQQLHKSIVETGMLFLSYPVDMNTTDCFRWNDNSCTLVVLDAKKLHASGFKFYDDHFSMKDQSSKRNHLTTDVDIPKEFIKKLIEF